MKSITWHVLLLFFWNTIMQESWYGDFPQCNKPKVEKNRAYYLHHKNDLGENAEEDEDDD